MKLRDFLPPAVSRVLARAFGASGPGWLFDRPESTTATGQGLVQPYRNSVWIQQAIRTKQAEIVSAPLKFYEADREFTDPQLAAWWAGRPFLGPGRSRLKLSEIREASVGWLDLAGERFIILGDDWLVPFPETRSASLGAPILARPDRMRHVVTAGELIGWEFTDAAGRRHPLLPGQVLHRKLWNPYDDWRGLAPVDAIFLAAESDWLAGNYVRNLMRNNGDQGVYVIAKGGVVADEQREQIVRDLRAKRAASLRGDFRPVFLTGDISIEDAKAQAPDANINQSRLLDRHTVFIGLGLPASMADVQASYSIGSDSDRFRLITGTCMGQARMVDEDFGDIASRQTGRQLTAEADWDEHPVVQEVRRSRVDSLVKLWGLGMPAKHANDYLDLGMQPFPGWEQGYLPFSVAPADGLTAPEQDPRLAEPIGAEGEEDDVAMSRIALALRGRRQLRCARPVPEGCACSPDCDGPVPKGRDPAQVARWREHMRARREHIASFRSRFTRWLLAVRAEVLGRIERDPTLAKSVSRAAAGDLLFNVADATASFAASMRRQLSLTLNAAGEQLMREIGRDDPFTFAPDEVLRFIRDRENKLAGVPADVFARLQSTLQEGLDAGESIADLSARIRAECNAIDKGRSLVIAQTETAAAFGTGRQRAMVLAGITHKAWLTSGNDNVRASHLQAGLDYPPERGIPLAEPFIVGGESLMFPADPSGSPGEVINCHCVQIAVPAPEGEGA